MAERYNHTKIEKKWQERWEKEHTFVASDNPARPKEYLLVEFPFPSGEGLHTGHVRSYTAMDIIARKRRAEGKNVLYPIGWDAFGLPTENYALKIGKNPRLVTKENTDTFRRQLKSLGLSFDWSREVNTTDPGYYKWTQWIFLQLYKHGLAYKARTLINWCPKDKIGLANEEVIDGHCERCGTAVEKREKEQWMLAITKYAKRLYDDLDTVNYIPAAIAGQRNWIGPSEGAEITFPLTWPTPTMEVVFATNNEGKMRRMQKLIAAAKLPITLKTPKELGFEFSVVEDGRTLAENAEKKARAVAEKANLPVLADDTGFYIPSATLDPITVKRNALAGVDEQTLSVEEVGKRMHDYYQHIAEEQGGKILAEWRNALCFITPEKIAVHEEAVRPVTLTSESRGVMDPYLPVRPLYISNITGKHVLEETEEEELLELKPITDALRRLFTPSLTVFTTRPDTLCGATYLVLAPEHPFVEGCIQRKAISNTTEVEKYASETRKRSEIDRTAEGKEKTGVEIKGVRAVNPATNEQLPIFVADYVLGNYGTGAIMAVPAHDERDWDFAQTFNLPARYVIMPELTDPTNPPQEGKENTERNTILGIVHDPKRDMYLCLRWKTQPWTTFITGGMEEGEDPVEAARREIAEETGYKNLTVLRVVGGPTRAHFYAAHKGVNRSVTATTVLFELADTTRDAISAEEEAQYDVVWLTPEEIVAARLQHAEFDHIWDQVRMGVDVYTGPGVLINSASFSGLNNEEAKKKITEWVGGKFLTTYKLRDWVFSRQRYWGEPIPMVHCEKDGWVAIPEDQLPVTLPEVEKYQPTDTGESPLANISDWVATTCPQCGGPATRETDVMPNWAGSSWYYLRYTDPRSDKALAAAEKLAYWTPVDWYNGGMEHTTLHLLYSRFWHKFLFDIGVVPTSEPYMKRTSHGSILAEDGRKMSKSLGNVVNPDELVERYGADSLRLYEMFVGPFDQSAVWNSRSILGVRRFLERLWQLSETLMDVQPSSAVETLRNQTIKKVSEDIEGMKFNTAVSALMIFANVLNEEKKVSKKAFQSLLQLVAPFAPHLAAELWEKTGGEGEIDQAPWPSFDPHKLASDTTTIAVQVNGKVRGSVTLPAGASKDEAIAAARKEPLVSKWLGEGKERQVIYVAGKILNFVLDLTG